MLISNSGDREKSRKVLKRIKLSSSIGHREPSLQQPIPELIIIVLCRTLLHLWKNESFFVLYNGLTILRN